MHVSNNLDLHVARLLDILFNQQSVVAKAGLGLGGGNLKVLSDILVIPSQTVSLPSMMRTTHQAMRIPLPPPPADALIMIGYPISLADHGHNK